MKEILLLLIIGIITVIFTGLFKFNYTGTIITTLILLFLFDYIFYNHKLS